MTPMESGDALEHLLTSWRESPFPTAKISSYFPAYVALFGHLRAKACTFVEIGVQDGGSLYMWRDWLGDDARIIGIDLNPAVAQWREHGFEIFIGDQGDPEFLRRTLAEIGPFDVLLDDGGHQSFQQIVTVHEALRAAKNRCLVVVEDTATSFMRDFSMHGEHSFLEFSKDATDLLTGRSFNMYPDRFIHGVPNAQAIERFGSVFSIEFFNGLVAFKVAPDQCVPSREMLNQSRSMPKDFRYSGANEATVEWPSIDGPKTLVVSGAPSRQR